jgi:hypothetical protein
VCNLRNAETAPKSKMQARGRAREVTTNSHVRAADGVRRLDVWEVEGEGRVGWCGGECVMSLIIVLCSQTHGPPASLFIKFTTVHLLADAAVDITTASRHPTSLSARGESSSSS